MITVYFESNPSFSPYSPFFEAAYYKRYPCWAVQVGNRITSASPPVIAGNPKLLALPNAVNDGPHSSFAESK